MPFVRRLVLILIMLGIIIFPSPVAHAANKSLTIGTIEQLNDLDPADAGDVFTWAILTHLYNGLIRQIPGSLRYELSLAASHTVSADGLQHTFTIRPDAAFSDGTPITAQTFADSINRVRRLNGRASSLVTTYLKSAQVDSAGALVLILNAPTPYLEQLLALPPFFAVNPSDFTHDSFSRSPATLTSSGVYKLVTFQRGQAIMLEANPAWKGDPPATPTITIRHYERPSDLRRALLAHEIDIIWRGLPPDEIEKARQTQGIKESSAPGLQTFYLLISQSKPFDKHAARQGLAYLIDRDYLTQTSLRGSANPLYSLLPPELMPDNAPTFPKYSVAQSKAILQNAGYSKFNTIDGSLQTASLIYGDLSRRAVDQLITNLRQAEAYQVSPNDLEPATFSDQIHRGTFTLILIGWTPVVPHPDAYLRDIFYSKAQLALAMHYANPSIDDLLDKAALTSNPAAYQQVITLATNDLAVIPLWQDRQTILAWNSVTGIVIEANYLLRLDRLVSQ